MPIRFDKQSLLDDAEQKHSDGHNDYSISHRPWLKIAGLGLAGLGVLTTAFDSFYTVSPTQMAGVRRLGNVVSTQPVGPGPHLKIPFIDDVDKLEVQQQSLPGTISVHTVDNQEVNLTTRLLYTIPKDAVLYLLYGVGKAGTADIEEQIKGAEEDRTGKIFSKQNTLEISNNRNALSDDIKVVLKNDLKYLYKIDVKDFQIDKIDYSKGFNDYNERAMRSKADAIAAANKVAEMRSKGDQDKATADAAAYVMKTAADAQAYKNRAEGQGQADAIKAQRGMFTSDEEFVKYTAAKAWDGHQPQVVGSGTTTLLQGVLGAIGTAGGKGPADQPK